MREHEVEDANFVFLLMLEKSLQSVEEDLYKDFSFFSSTSSQCRDSFSYLDSKECRS